MSFADQLRNNYNPDTEQSLKERRMQYTVYDVTQAIKTTCNHISDRSRVLAGYYEEGYDMPIIRPVKSNTVTMFLLDSDVLRKQKEAVRDVVFSVRDQEELISRIRREVQKMGFSTMEVRAEACESRRKVGYTTFLAREKYVNFPAFCIYFKVTW